MPIEMVENKQVHACKGKNLAQEFDASSALDGPMKFRGQSSCETLNDCTIGSRSSTTSSCCKCFLL